MSKPFTVSLTLSEKQSDVLVAALDLYSRILIGQFEEIAWLSNIYGVDMLPANDPDKHHKLSAEIRILKQTLLNIPSNGSYGIFSEKVHDNARVAYDIQQVLRNAVAWHRYPEGGMQVSFDTPRQTSQESLPIGTINPSNRDK